MIPMRIYCLLILLLLPLSTTAGVLVFTPVSRDFHEAVEALRANLVDQSVSIQELDDSYSASDMEKALREQRPSVIVLFDNKSIRLYRSYLEEVRPQNPPAVVALMALQIESSLLGIPNTLGISYEIPAVTTATRLRAIWTTPIQKVGVVYRSSMESFFRENQKFCKVENIQLIGRKVSDDAADLGRELRYALQGLAESDQVDALWVLNDNKLLTSKLIREIWIPFMRSNPKPGIVGVELLAQTKIGLGAFAVLPDNAGLGAQAANLVYEIMDNGNKVDRTRIDQPLAVIQVLNTTLARKVGTPRTDAAKSVDRIVE